MFIFLFLLIIGLVYLGYFALMLVLGVVLKATAPSESLLPQPNKAYTFEEHDRLMNEYDKQWQKRLNMFLIAALFIISLVLPWIIGSK